MKKRYIGTIVTTLAVVVAGSIILAMSAAKAKEQVQTDLSGDVEIGTDYESADILGKTDAPEKVEEDIEDPNIQLFYNRDVDGYSSLPTESKLPVLAKMYKGHLVMIKDSLVNKEIAENNAINIMEFLYDTVDKNLLAQNGIDLTEYETHKERYAYHIQRQYQYEDKTCYGVFVLEKAKIIWSVNICLEEEPKVITFAMDGLVDLAGGIGSPIPNEYLVENWCKTTEQKEAIYNQYFETSKEIIEETLGLSAIRTDVKDLEYSSYFDADNDWSTVCFGYVLEDGLYVKVFYNRVNQKWDGFAIAGYHKDYYDVAK